MYIGKFAERCGVSIKTIRHYEAIGLLPAAKRQGMYRVFSESDAELVHLIKQSQQLGFQLSEIKAAIAASEHGIPWQVICQLIEQKQQAVKQEIQRLQQIQQQLQQHQQAILDCLRKDPSCKLLLS